MKSWLLPGETPLRSMLRGTRIEVDDASGCRAAAFELNVSSGTIAQSIVRRVKGRPLVTA